MRFSPVQLRASAIERLRIDPVVDQAPAPQSDVEFLDAILFHRHCAKAADYWEDDGTVDPGLQSRTYLIRLGLKTRFDVPKRLPYRFEIVASGIFSVSVERLGIMPAEDVAAQYGFTMLLGTIREALLLNTSRMPNGQLLLPTFTFIGEKFADSQQAATLTQKPLPLEGGKPFLQEDGTSINGE